MSFNRALARMQHAAARTGRMALRGGCGLARISSFGTTITTSTTTWSGWVSLRE